MTDTPERIWAWPDDVEDGFMAASRVGEPPKPEYDNSHVEYIRLDRYKAAILDRQDADAEIERLRAALALFMKSTSAQKGWGTYPRMDSPEMYSEIDRAKAAARELLTPTDTGEG